MIRLLNKLPGLILVFLLFSPGLRGLSFIYFPLLAVSIILSLPLILSSLKFIFNSKLSSILILFNLIVAFGLLPSIQEFKLEDIFVSFSRIILNILFILVLIGFQRKDKTVLISSIYLLVCFIASAFIYIQYITGPINIFSEVMSMRAGLPRFSTLSGSTNMFSISVSFSILLSTFLRKEISFFRVDGMLLLYQLFVLGAAVANISRSGLLASIGVFFFSRFYLLLDFLNLNFFEYPLIFKTKIKFFNSKIKKTYIYISLGLSTAFFIIFDTLMRYLKTILYFVSGNKDLLMEYSNATYESKPVIGEFFRRFFFFADQQLSRNLIYEPWIIFIGDGSKHYGGTIGLPRAYAHNMFLDVFQAQGLLGLSLLAFIFVILFFNSTETKYHILKQSFDIRALSITTLFFFYCTHNSGILFHPLSLFPILLVQDFIKIPKILD